MNQNKKNKDVNELLNSRDLVPVAKELHSTRSRVVNKYTVAITLIVIVILSTYYFLTESQIAGLQDTLQKDHYLFFWMLLVGFLAEIIAGSMGMGYGVICTSVLLFLGVQPHIVSASIHSAESFTSAVGSFSHWQLGNVNKKLVKALAIPAIIGAIIGAFALTYAGEYYAKLTKPFIALYTMYLGYRILKSVFKERKVRKRKTNIPALATFGGFIDSFGGGGWGPLVTGTFIKNGRTPRYVIGSSTTAKFLLTVASAATFVLTVGIKHWNIVAGLLIGGIITAPFSAMLTARLPVKKMEIAVGSLVIVLSLITFIKAVFL